MNLVRSADAEPEEMPRADESAAPGGIASTSIKVG